jgi:hypothetical protein
MPATDELSASTQIFQAALRAKAREPLTVSKFIDLARCTQDVHGGYVWNADALIGEVRAKHPELFDEPVVVKPPAPPKEDRTKDAFTMTEEEFDNVWAGRFPWTK